MNTRTPTSDQNTLYIPRNKNDAITFIDIQRAVEAHFGTSDLTEFNFDAIEYHARHLGYDLYDPNDYDHYFVIERNFSI